MAEIVPVEEPLGPRVSAIIVTLNQMDPLRKAVAALDRSTDRDGWRSWWWTWGARRRLNRGLGGSEPALRWNGGSRQRNSVGASE
jgi:hypothetical protein